MELYTQTNFLLFIIFEYTTTSKTKKTNKVFTYNNNFTIPDRTYIVGTKTYYLEKVSTLSTHSIPTILSSDKCGSQMNGKYGYCGTGSKYCDTDCKPNYGKCW
ncbi:hypothetical protein U3516DRAFT_773301 [Neocallimastix sp. 'constans']